MKSSCIRVLSLAVTAAALFTTSASFGAAFIKFDGIDGESRVQGREKWIELSSVTGVITAREAGSGLATGRRQYQPVIIRKRIDKASPLLAKACSGKVVFQDLHLQLDDGACKLTNATIASITVEGEIEVLSITFEKIEMQAVAAPAPDAEARAIQGKTGKPKN